MLLFHAREIWFTGLSELFQLALGSIGKVDISVTSMSTLADALLTFERLGVSEPGS